MKKPRFAMEQTKALGLEATELLKAGLLSQRAGKNPGGGGTAIYGPYRYVPL